jgi:hypothetical protein
MYLIHRFFLKVNKYEIKTNKEKFYSTILRTLSTATVLTLFRPLMTYTVHTWKTTDPFYPCFTMEDTILYTY